jgi:hypothetical protein
VITILVGPNKTKFTAFRDHICERSKFFEAACAPGRWREGEEKSVPLPDVEPCVFKTYLHWTMTGQLLPEIHWDRGTTSVGQQQETHVEAYILGDFLDDAKCRDHAIAQMITKLAAWACVLLTCLIVRIWDATPDGSPLRTLVLHRVMHRANREYFRKMTGH